MESIILSKAELRNSYPIIGSGYEAEVFGLDENTVLKAFRHTPDIWPTIPNKIRKVEEIESIIFDDSFLPQVKQLAFERCGIFIGYTLSRIHPRLDVPDLFDACDAKLSIAEKINYYYMVEEIAIALMVRNIYLIDTNLKNFMITKDNSVMLTDVDGLAIGSYSADRIPIYYAQYYQDKTGDKTLKYHTEFALTIRLLELLVYNFREKAHYAVKNNKMDYIEQVVSCLDIPNELKIVLLSTLSADGKKEFIGPYLDCIANPNERYLRRKNSFFH